MSESETKLGRPSKILDAEQIARFVGKGFTVEWVADYFGVAASTLYRNYSDALRKGHVFRNGCLQAKQYHTAMAKNNVTMQIWLGKQWLAQRDKTEITEGNKPIECGTNLFGAATDAAPTRKPN